MSIELANTQCYEFECFEDNYSLTISTQGCRVNTSGEGKTKNEFAEWHAAWLAEWHNYVECNICRMTERNRLN